MYNLEYCLFLVMVWFLVLFLLGIEVIIECRLKGVIVILIFEWVLGICVFLGFYYFIFFGICIFL